MRPAHRGRVIWRRFRRRIKPEAAAGNRLDDALATALRLQDEVGAWCQDQGIDPPLALKVGVHHGPAIAMTANDRLDYFGRTVNLAARVADQSRGGDVVVLREVLDQAGRPSTDLASRPSRSPPSCAAWTPTTTWCASPVRTPAPQSGLP